MGLLLESQKEEPSPFQSFLERSTDRQLRNEIERLESVKEYCEKNRDYEVIIVIQEEMASIRVVLASRHAPKRSYKNKGKVETREQLQEVREFIEKRRSND